MQKQVAIGELVLAAFFVILGLLWVGAAVRMPLWEGFAPQSGFMPLWYGILLIGLTGAVLFDLFRQKEAAKAEDSIRQAAARAGRLRGRHCRAGANGLWSGHLPHAAVYVRFRGTAADHFFGVGGGRNNTCAVPDLPNLVERWFARRATGDLITGPLADLMQGFVAAATPV